MDTQPGRDSYPELFVPHIGWLVHEPGDAVAVYLNQGWFEYKEQAFAWLFLREGDTVVDCGAHFGLYSALAARAGAGAILAIEANASTLPVLRQNLQSLGRPDARIIAKAVSSQTGETSFFPAGSGLAAYSSLVPDAGAAAAIPVSAITLDDLLAEHSLASVDYAKIDVEGSEIEVLDGAVQSLVANRLPLVMVEFTEQNLARSGRSTKDLFAWAEAHGCQVHRFDPQTRQLVPCGYEGPVWYENLFLARDAAPLNQRLAAAPESRQRIARELLERGRAAGDLYQQAETAAQAKRNEEEAYRRLDEVYGLLAGERARMQELRKNLRPYLASRYVELGWKLGVIAKPEWLARFAAEEPELETGHGE